MDLALHLIRTMCGADVANRLAKGMVLPPHRPGGQAQHIESPIPQLPDADPVAETMTWALTELDTSLRVDELAQRAHMSRRNCDRRFREIAGTAPATWLIHQRVVRAQRLLVVNALDDFLG
jgi:transcriptional regulator GlxA family with amidase domain